MKQKILYILMIAAFFGRGEMVFGQEAVAGYKYVTTKDFTCEKAFTDGNDLVLKKTESNWLGIKSYYYAIVLNQENEIKQDVKVSITFSLGDGIKEYTNGGLQIYQSYNKNNTITWSVPTLYYINLKGFSAGMKCSLVGNSRSVKFTPSTGNYFEGSANSTISVSNLNLGNSGSIKVEASSTSDYYYFKSLSYTYTLSYYELNISALNTAIELANAEKFSEENLGGKTKATFTEALKKANTVKAESSFPTSYWNDEPKGKQNPESVDIATKQLNTAIELANAYIAAKTEINNIATKGQSLQTGLSVNINEALKALNDATTIGEINEAKNMVSIILERYLPQKQYFTLTLPFDYNLSGITDGKDIAYAAQLALVTHNEKDCYTLYFKQVEDGQMRANQPYIVWLPVGFDKPNFGNVNINLDTPGSISVNYWIMQGNYTPNTPMNGNFGIAKGLLCKGEGKDAKINAYTAYFIPPTHSHGTENVRARVAVMDGAGNTTYIGELSDLNADAVEEVFGIDGMRLPEMRRGINIVRQKDGSVRKIVK